MSRHPVPGIDHGTYAFDNVRPACGPCNNRSDTALREEHRAARLEGTRS